MGGCLRHIGLQDLAVPLLQRRSTDACGPGRISLVLVHREQAFSLSIRQQPAVSGPARRALAGPSSRD
jgi:hypothetical protein